MSDGDFLTVGQVAELVDFPQETVLRLASAGRMPGPFYAYGSLWSRAEIIGWINAGGLERASQAPIGEFRPDRFTLSGRDGA